MYCRYETSAALLQLGSQRRRELGGGGGSGRLLQQTVARKHLWHLSSLSWKMPNLTDGGAGVKCHSDPQRSLKHVAHVSIKAAVFTEGCT